MNLTYLDVLQGGKINASNVNIAADDIYKYCSQLDSNPYLAKNLEREYFSLRESAELLRGAKNTIYVYSIILLAGGVVVLREYNALFVLILAPLMLAFFFSRAIKYKYKRISSITREPFVRLSAIGLEEEFKRISLDNPNLSIWPESKRDLYLADYLWAKVQIDAAGSGGRHLGVRGRTTAVV